MGTYGWTEDDINAHRAKRAREAAEADGHPVKYRGLESPIKDACLELLAIHPKMAMVWRNNVGAMKAVNRDGTTRYVAFGVPGSSDIQGVIKGGRFFSCEVKRPGETPTPDQYDHLEAVKAAGGFACWVTSVDQLNELLVKA